jgi:hypothetical protein
VTRPTEIVPSLRLQVGDGAVEIRDVSVLPRAPDEEVPDRDGVLGMDALSGGFALDFETMRLWVRALAADRP